MSSLNKVREIAKRKKIVGEIKISSRADKRFMINVGGRWVHFGAKNGQTFIDHKDEVKRRNWRARHRMIMKKGMPAHLLPQSPAYYSWNLLW